MNSQPISIISTLKPFLILFGALSLTVFLFSAQLQKVGVELLVLHAANFLMFLVSALASLWLSRQIRQPGGLALLRGFYGGFMIRFFLIALSAFIYIFLKRKQVNIPGLIGGALFYILYWSVEIHQLRAKIKSSAPHA